MIPPSGAPTTEGRVLPGCEIRVIDADGSGHVLPVDATGEICVRGPLICHGYLDPARNEEAFDADGFFRTGDLGSVDEHGNLTVSGRLKDVIIRKGENIAAKDVEDVLYEHPDVADVAVIGLPDSERGERACAVVVLRDGAGAVRPRRRRRRTAAPRASRCRRSPSRSRSSTRSPATPAARSSSTNSRRRTAHERAHDDGNPDT